MIKKANGFTLIELLLSLGIVGMIVAVAIPRVFGLAKDQTLDYAAQSLANMIVQGRNIALNSPDSINSEVGSSNILGRDTSTGVVDPICNAVTGKPLRLAGTIITSEPPSGNYTTITIREWAVPKTDEPVGSLSSSEICRVSNINTPNTQPDWTKYVNDNFPVIKSLRLPKGIFVQATRSGVFEDDPQNPNAPPSPVWSPSTEVSQPFVLFVKDDLGRPTLQVYGNKVNPDPNAAKNINIRWKVCNDSNVCSTNISNDLQHGYRLVEISVPQGGVTVLSK